jgi:hypothetical protein
MDGWYQDAVAVEAGTRAGRVCLEQYWASADSQRHHGERWTSVTQPAWCDVIPDPELFVQFGPRQRERRVAIAKREPLMEVNLIRDEDYFEEWELSMDRMTAGEWDIWFADFKRVLT